MQALALSALDVGLVSLLIVPRVVSGTSLHRRKDMHQPRMIAANLENLADTLFLAEPSALADELDFQFIFFGNRFRVGPNDVSQWLCKLFVVKNANPVYVEILGHPFGITHWVQVARDDDAIIAVQDTGSLGFRMGGPHMGVPPMSLRLDKSGVKSHETTLKNAAWLFSSQFCPRN